MPANFDWSLTGLETTKSGSEWSKLGVKARDGRMANLRASLILPQGRKGPAFLAYPNFNVYLRVEPKLHLRPDRRLFRHPPERREGL